MFVFATGAAMAGLIAARSCAGRISHWNECTVPAAIERQGLEADAAHGVMARVHCSD
jgi:hypothetical protein